MTNAQNYSAAGMATVKVRAPTIDTTVTTGVHYKVISEALVTPAMVEVQRIMQDIRATGKCGMFVARWDGQAWCFHVCNAPARINE